MRSDSSATAVVATGVGSPVSQPSGARRSHSACICAISPPSPRASPAIAFAARVRMGPAAMRLERTPSGPSSRATYRLTASRAFFATDIQL